MPNTNIVPTEATSDPITLHTAAELQPILDNVEQAMLSNKTGPQINVRTKILGTLGQLIQNS